MSLLRLPMRPAQLLCVMGALAMSPAWGVTSAAQRIAELESQLAHLAARLQALEARSPLPSGSPPAPVAASNVAANVPPAATTPAAADNDARATVLPTSAGLPIHAFVDVGYARDSNDPTGRRGGFGVGNVNLYMTPSWGGQIKSILEIVFEQDDHGELLIDLERVQIGYTVSDALTGWAGRYHTPFGYWNAAFHHGAQIQTSILRPRFLAFEDQGGILPVHGIGLMASGSVPLAGGRTKYDLYVANGTPIEGGVLAVRAFKDDDGQKMFGGNIRHEFGGSLYGLTLGVHALTSRVNSYDGTGALLGSTRLSVAGAYAVLDRGGWDLMAEYYAFRNKDLGAATGQHSSWAGYVQGGYRLGDRLTPYVRLERATLDQADTYFATMDSGRSYRRGSFGLRYELNPVTTIKIELGRTTEEGLGTRSNGVRSQLAVRF